MAPVTPSPLLCICIPIYNRQDYLMRMLDRFYEDAVLFQEDICLIVSDNCSQQDLKSCCDRFLLKGLNLYYHRNEENLGSNGNFLWCFNHVNGKYLWLLGSDDVPKKGFLRDVIKLLKEKDYGLIHYSMSDAEKRIAEYTDGNQMIVDVNYWITFMSSNIIQSSSLSSVNLSKYLSTWLIQVPAYINACFSSSKNAIVYGPRPFESDTDNINNGGYNFFQVFIENLLGIYGEFVEKGQLSNKAFETIKRDEYRNYLLGFIIETLFLKGDRRNNFDMTNSWRILLKNYGKYPYAYYYLFARLLKKIKSRLFE